MRIVNRILTILVFMLVLFLFGCEMSALNSTTQNNDSNNTTIESTTIKESDTMSDIVTDSTTKPLSGEPIAVGIWHRPNVMGNETTLDGVINTIETFKKCGINIVYLETIYHGMAIYKSNFLPYYTGFSNHNYGEYKDYLSAFTTEADKRGIEVHAWVEDFYIGIEEGNIVKNHPDWILLTDKGSKKQTEGNGYIFLDPANKEVTDFLINVYYELLSKHPLIKGLNLDYIRYPISSSSDDTGYTKCAMTEFLSQLGYDTIDESQIESTFKSIVKSKYNEWVQYRSKKVTHFVRDVREMTMKNFKNIILSTAIFPNASEAYNQKKQDFSLWIKYNYLDVVTPMAYYDSVSTLEYYLKEMMKNQNGVYFYTGVSCFYHDLSANTVNEQINKCLDLSDGFVIFGSQKLLNNQTYINLLESRFKNTEYYLPHLK